MVRVHWTPFQEIDTLERELSRIFESLTPNVSEATQRPQGVTYTPAVEMQDTSDAILLRVELPGLKLDAFDIEATADSVTIQGDRQRPTEENAPTRSEFRYGRFYRKLSVPVQIRNADVSATYVDGILSLTLPKVQADQPKVVKVTVQ